MKIRPWKLYPSQMSFVTRSFAEGPFDRNAKILMPDQLACYDPVIVADMISLLPWRSLGARMTASMDACYRWE